MRKTALLAAVALAFTAPAAVAATVAVTADRLIDVATGARIERPQVIITDGRIASVGRQGDIVPAGAERVDLPGVTLVPGLIDMHVHITSSPLYGGYTGLVFTDSFWPVIGVAHAKVTLEAGFTTIRNVGSEGYGDVGLKQAIEAGFVPGPRIVPAAYALGATGGHCDSTFFPPSMNEQSPAVVDSPDEARRMVRKMRKYGAEVIKICATGGVFSRGSSPGAQQMTLAEMQAGVRMVYGTDAGVYPHGDNARQFAVLVQWGASPLQALQSATINAAEALGQVKVGAWSDLVGVKGDPLADVRVLEKPVFVMKGGETVRRP